MAINLRKKNISRIIFNVSFHVQFHFFYYFSYFLTNATGMGFKCDSANGVSTCELFQTPQELPPGQRPQDRKP